MDTTSIVNKDGSPLPIDSKDKKRQPKSLGAALREAGVSLDGSPSSETASEEDYDDMVKRDKEVKYTKAKAGGATRTLLSETPLSERPSLIRTDSGVHFYPEDEETIQLFLKRSLERAKDPDQTNRKKAKFRDLVFSRQFSTFDRQNALASSSPFHGFYTLFWMATALYVFKISAENWRTYGTPLGSSEILTVMFSKDVLVLLISDGVMCGATGVSWGLQKLTQYGYIDWNMVGWIIQNIWQIAFITAVVGWTLVRDWPWTHTVFFVLHGIVMLMKQHSYAFYNGHLSSVFKRRKHVLAKLKDLEALDPTSDTATSSSAAPHVSTISTNHLKSRPSAATRRDSLAHVKSTESSDIDRIAQAVANREPLDDEQIHVFERIIKWEIDALSDELKGATSDASKSYPANLSFIDHYKWIPLPTLVYELEYPRSDKIDWSYVAEKFIAMIGVLFVMVQVSQHSIYPVVIKTVAMKEANMPLAERIAEFPWMLSELIFPFMMEYLLVWYLIWETILNILAELTYFADRSFYDAWWNSVSWDQFARDWNRPVHIFLLRHVYHSSISSMKVNKHTATLITFFLSACIHELVMWCLFKKLRGYLLLLQMSQLPLVRLSRTKWLKNQKTLGNLIFWLGIFTGPSLLCSLYLIL